MREVIPFTRADARCCFVLLSIAENLTIVEREVKAGARLVHPQVRDAIDDLSDACESLTIAIQDNEWDRADGAESSAGE